MRELKPRKVASEISLPLAAAVYFSHAYGKKERAFTPKGQLRKVMNEKP